MFILAKRIASDKLEITGNIVYIYIKRKEPIGTTNGKFSSRGERSRANFNSLSFLFRDFTFAQATFANRIDLSKVPRLDFARSLSEIMMELEKRDKKRLIHEKNRCDFELCRRENRNGGSFESLK